MALEECSNPHAMVERSALLVLRDDSGREAFGLHEGEELLRASAGRERAKLHPPTALGERTLEADDLDSDTCDATIHEIDLLCRREREVDDAAPYKGTTVIDDDVDVTVRVQNCDAYERTEGKRPMRGRESLRVHKLTARRSSAHFLHAVPGGDSLLSVDRGSLGYDDWRSASGTCCDEQECRDGNVQTMFHVNGIIARKESWVLELPEAGKGRIAR